MSDVEAMGFLGVDGKTSQNHPLRYLFTNYPRKHLRSTHPRNQTQSYFRQSKTGLFRAEYNIAEQGQFKAPTKGHSLNNSNDGFVMLPEKCADDSKMDAIGVGAEIISLKLFDVCTSAECLAVLAANDNDLHCCLMVQCCDCLHEVDDHHPRKRV